MSEGMSDEELDREWKPSQNKRPQSTMAKSFSLALNDLFDLDNKLADMDAKLFEKKKAVSSQTSELEALEARLRATEERLKKAGLGGAAMAPAKPSGRSSPRQRTALGDTFQQSPATSEHPTSPLATEQKTSRPNTGRPQTKEGRPGSGWRGEAHPSYNSPVPGALPPTPGASEGEGESDSDYVLIERERNSADHGQDGEYPEHK